MNIKKDLIVRLRAAKDQLGNDWRKKLVESDDSYNTYEGAQIILHASQAISSDKCRMGIYRLHRITIALEKAAGIEHVPII